MRTPSPRPAFAGCAVLIATMATAIPAAAQGPVPMKLTINVAGQTQTVRGTGECSHEPHGYIYGRKAALWLAQYAGAQAAPHVSLSYWRPAAAGAADQFSLTVSRSRSEHNISTIVGKQRAGSGRSSFRPTATGGRFEISGTAQDGAALQVTIECARFGGIYAEGG